MQKSIEEIGLKNAVVIGRKVVSEPTKLELRVKVKQLEKEISELRDRLTNRPKAGWYGNYRD